MKKQFLFLILFFFHFNIVAQHQVIDSLKLELKKTNENTIKVNLLLDLSIAYRTLNIDQSVTHGQQALELAQSVSYNGGIINSLVITAYSLYSRGENSLAIEYLEEALVLTNKTNYKKRLPNIFNSLGGIHNELGNFDKAIDYFSRVLELFDEEEEKESITSVLSNIALIHSNQKDYKRALEYYERALATAQELKNKTLTAYITNNIGTLYIDQKEFDKALPYFKKYLDLSKEQNNKVFISTALSKIGQVHLLKNKIKLAENYFSKSLEIKKETGDKKGIAYTLISLGEMNHMTANYTESNRYYLESLNYFHSSGMLVKEREVYEKLSQNYAELGDFDKAFQAQQVFIALSDSLFTTQKSEQILELATKYETKQKATENRFLKEEQAKNKAIIQRRTTLGVTTILFLTLASIIAFISYQQKKKNNQQLNKEVQLLNKNLENQKVIEIQSKKLRLVEQQKSKLFTNIAHEFQTPLAIIQGLTNQLFKTERLTNSGTQALSIVLRNSKYLSEATNQILRSNSFNQETNPNNFVLFSLLHLIKHILPEYTFLAEEKKITIETSEVNIHQITIYSDVNKLETILKNLLSNAIKYTNEGGTIAIKYSIIDDSYHQLKIEDNGRGIPEEELPHLFDRYYQSDSNDSDGGFGLGLAICKENITSLDGTINVDSTLGKGSSFTLNLPKALKKDIPMNIDLYEFPENKIPYVPETNQELVTSDSKIDLLIVEDNKDFCKYLDILLKDDYYLHFTHNGQQALSFLEKDKPYLIITDWMMPGMDGLSFVQQLKTSKEYKNIPVLMLTAKSLASDKIKALRVGVDDYLIKPFEEEVLKTRINHLIDIKDRTKEYDQKSTFDSVSIGNQELALQDQDWLINLEKIILPLLGDFDLNLDKIVKLLNTNVKVLNRKIKKITGLTPKKYIQELRYWEARKMLETREYDSVKAVCISVGFKDQKNFSRKFKNRFGVYPSELLQMSNS